jgi:cytochrome c-type biogenesis protein CcmH/NrfG
LHNPPRPLTEVDIWFQTGHVYEQQKEYELAKEAYERVLSENPDHAKVLQQLGWLFHQQNTSFSNQPTAIQYLTRSLKADSADAQSWYLLGRCYMVEQNYNKAYEAYQQAVYRDARNPTFWCSIGVLYYQINQYRDALDAYSRAIRLNPYISEVWYDLGTLYESCNNQIQDALDAYQRASELDPSNPHIRTRLELLRKSNPTNPPAPTPVPQDVNNPYQYQNGSANTTPQYPPPPLVSGPQQGNANTYPPRNFNNERMVNSDSLCLLFFFHTNVLNRVKKYHHSLCHVNFPYLRLVITQAAMIAVRLYPL